MWLIPVDGSVKVGTAVVEKADINQSGDSADSEGREAVSTWVEETTSAKGLEANSPDLEEANFYW